MRNRSVITLALIDRGEGGRGRARVCVRKSAGVLCRSFCDGPFRWDECWWGRNRLGGCLCVCVCKREGLGGGGVHVVRCMGWAVWQGLMSDMTHKHANVNTDTAEEWKGGGGGGYVWGREGGYKIGSNFNLTP